MATTAKAIPKFEVASEECLLKRHRHQQTENELNARDISYELKFLSHESISGGEIYQVRNVEKSALIAKENSAHISQKIYEDLKESDQLNCIFPAIVVIKTVNEKYTLIDGRHRHAVLSAKNKKVPAYIVDSTLPQEYCSALATVFNDFHGTPNDLEVRKSLAIKMAINYINEKMQSLENLVRGDQTKFIKEAASMYLLTLDCLTVAFEIDEGVRLMRRAGVSEDAIKNIGATLKRSLRVRLKTGEQESNYKMVNEIASCGLDQKVIQEIIKNFKESSNLELSQEIKKASLVKEDGKIKTAGQISRDQAANRFLETMNGALGLLENRIPQSLKLSIEQKADVQKNLLLIAKESMRWVKLFEREFNA